MTYKRDLPLLGFSQLKHLLPHCHELEPIKEVVPELKGTANTVPSKIEPLPVPKMQKHPLEFVSAYDKLLQDNQIEKTNDPAPKRRNLGSRKFNSPLVSADRNKDKEAQDNKKSAADGLNLKNVDPMLIETIMNEIMENIASVTWKDVCGLAHAKKSIQEIVVLPMLRPDIFTGLRSPPKGLLLFGPPGTGKTMIGKCIASQSNATFFSISSSSLTSVMKWVGESEKLIKALFAVARAKQPAVIFVDEIDSLLTQRTDGENDATRRIKTEFLVQFDGCATSKDDRILLIGATNRPQEIDEAARRRFRKKLYIPLPESSARCQIMNNLLQMQPHDLTDPQIEEIVNMTNGYSGSDMDGLIREAALGPIRDIVDIETISAAEVRGIQKQDFISALTQIRASVSEKDLKLYEEFDREYGSLK